MAAAEIDVGLPLLEVLALEFLEVKILAGLWSERSKQEVQSEKSWKSLQLGLIKVKVYHTCGSSEKHLVAVLTILTEPSDG